ncbi:MAG: hypothetical protein HC834_08100 [Rhodospirillales bacterium]|nr:hypothetical protein [Rhodospirillales bacterium]
MADDDPLTIDIGVFLDDNRIGVARQGGSGQDPNRLARRDRGGIGITCGDEPAQPQSSGGSTEISGANRISIHRGDGNRRQ